MSSDRHSTSKEPSSRRKKSSSRKRRSSRKNPIQEKNPRLVWLWVFLGVIGILVVGAVVYDRGAPKDIDLAGSETTPKKTFEALLDSDDFEAMARNHEEMGKTSLRSPFPILSDALTKQIKLTRRAREIAKTQQQREWADLNYLKNMLLLESLTYEQGLDGSEFQDELDETIKKFRTHSNPQIALNSDMASLLLHVNRFIRYEDWENRQDELKMEFSDALKKHPVSRKAAVDIQRAMLMLHRDPKYLTLEIEIGEMFADHYLKQEEPELVALGAKVSTQAVVFKYGLQKSEEAFIVSSQTAANEVRSKIDQIVSSEPMTTSLLLRLIGSYHVAEMFGQRDVAVEGLTKLRAIAVTMNGADAALAIKNCDDAITRCKAIGKKLQIDEQGVNGKAINDSTLPNLPLVIGYIPASSQRFDEVLEYLVQIKDNYRGRVHLIVVAMDGDMETILRQASLAGLQDDLVADPKRESQLFRQFPVNIAHSFLLLNSEREMVEMVVDVIDLDSRLLTLLNGDAK